MSTKSSDNCWRRKALRRSRNSRWSTSRSWPGSKASTTKPPPNCRTGPASIWSSVENELESKRKELGVEDALKTVPGMSSKMLVKFGENAIKTVEDLAGCATDDLIGWTERKEGGEATKHAGILDPNEISRDDAEHLIMQARVKAGWITEADLAKETAEAEAPEDQPV